MISALLTPKVSETSRTVAPELTLERLRLVAAQRLQLGRLVEGGAAAAAAAARRPLGRALRHVVAARGLRIDDDPAALLAGVVGLRGGRGALGRGGGLLGAKPAAPLPPAAAALLAATGFFFGSAPAAASAFSAVA